MITKDPSMKKRIFAVKPSGLTLLLVAIFCLSLFSVCPTESRADNSKNIANTSSKEDFPAFIVLPDYVSTPDGMTICPKTGDLIVACPNFGDDSKPACVIRINKSGKVTKWFDVPVDPTTKKAYPMGIEFAPDGSLFLCDNQNWPTGNGSNGELSQGRLLRIVLHENQIVSTTVVASNIPHPNGVKIRNGLAYVTVSCLPKVKAKNGLLYSGVYCFPLTAQNIQIKGTLEDAELIVAFQTKNLDCQYGADGLCFDESGNLYIGNFGDGTVLIARPNGKKRVTPQLYARSKPIPALNLSNGQPDPDFLTKATAIPLRTTDGMCRDPQNGDLYVADFSNNAIAKISGADRSVSFLAISPDNNGLDGGLNQPGEPCLWNGRLAVTCFDMVTGPDKVNTKHDPKATIVFLRTK